MGQQAHLNLYGQQLSYRIHAQCQKHQEQLLQACACQQDCSFALQHKTEGVSLPCRHMKAAWVCDTALLCTTYKSIEKA